MTKVRNSLFFPGLVTALMVASAPVIADQHPRHEGRQHHFEQRMQQRANALKTALRLSDAQQTAWNEFEKGMAAPKPPEDWKKRRDDIRQMTTPQRLDWMKEVHAQRAELGITRDKTIRNFYSQLDLQQQKVFDALFWLNQGSQGFKPQHSQMVR